MKKIISLLLVFVLCFGTLAACNKGIADDDTPDGGNTNDEGSINDDANNGGTDSGGDGTTDDGTTDDGTTDDDTTDDDTDLEISTKGLIYKLTEDDTSYVVTGLLPGSDKNVVIPTKHKGIPVTMIGESAFNECTEITSLTIPKSVTSIGNYAFAHCINLASITIPKSVTSIGNCAFKNCEALSSVLLSEGLTSIGACFNYPILFSI